MKKAKETITMKAPAVAVRLLAGVLALSRAVAWGSAHPVYTLDGDYKSAVTDAACWLDAEGNRGVAGAALDPNGEYHTRDRRIDFPTGKFHLDVKALHLGEVDGARAQSYYAGANYNQVFGVRGDGLFLNRGFCGIQWLPFEISDTITVQSPEGDPFEIYTAYGYPEGHEWFSRMFGTIAATLKSAAGTELRIYHSGASSPTTSKNTTYSITISGDCSAYFGTLSIGREDEADGRVTRVLFANDGLPGTVKVTKSAILAAGVKGYGVAHLVLSDGATLTSDGGTIAVTSSFVQHGTVRVSLDGVTLPNVERPEIRVLTVPAGAALDVSRFDLQGTPAGVATAGRTFEVETNADGTKSLVLRYARPTAYVSPAGSDSADGGDEAHPFQTLAYAVSRLTDGVIYVDEGTYDQGLCDVDDGTGAVPTVQSRVHVPSNVFLKSLKGAERTVIVGAPPTAGGRSGAGSTRCVRLDAGAVVQGFTLTGGHGDAAGAQENFPNRCGGAAHGEETSVVMDCIITNNFANWGGAVYVGNYVRCRFADNTAGAGGKCAFARSNLKTRLFDSIVAESGTGQVSIYQYVEAYNCHFTATEYTTPHTACKMYNCVFYSNDPKNPLQGGDNVYRRCVFARLPRPANEAGAMTDCQEIGDIARAFDASGYPVDRDGPCAIDAGDYAVYAAAYPRVAGGLDYVGNPRVSGKTIDIGAFESCRRDWFVKPDGSDAADGLTADTAFQTLAKAVTAARSGDTVWALPGTYAKGYGDADKTKTRSRVHIPAYVTLRSTDGAAKTTIAGEAPTAGGDFGDGATRGALLEPYATLVGFTVTGGYVHTDDDDRFFAESAGGGVRGFEGSAAIDCVFTGNTARRGGGAYGGSYVRCAFAANRATIGQWSGPDVFGILSDDVANKRNSRTRCFDCLFTDETEGYNHVYHSALLYNCTFTSAKRGGPQLQCQMYNCLLRTKVGLTGADQVFDHCVLAMTPSFTTGSMTDCEVASLDAALDEDYRPKAGCAAIDRGVYETYLAAWDEAGLSHDYLGRDFKGGQRVYGGQIDAGCGEHDLRADVSAAFRRVTVREMSAGVTLAGGRPQLHDGESLSLDWKLDGRGGFVECALEGTGALTVYSGETPLVTLTATGTAAIPSGLASADLRFAFASAEGGTATVQAMRRDCGTLLIVR